MHKSEERETAQSTQHRSDLIFPYFLFLLRFSSAFVSFLLSPTLSSSLFPHSLVQALPLIKQSNDATEVFGISADVSERVAVQAACEKAVKLMGGENKKRKETQNTRIISSTSLFED